MGAPDERVWLRHKDTGGAFNCPAEAVPDWLDLGWAPGDPPEDVNPVTAEMPKPPAPAVENTPAKAAKKAAPQEGSD